MSIQSRTVVVLLVIFVALPQLHAANTGQAVGTGINSIRNWGTSVPFVDLFKSARVDPNTANKYSVINPALTPALPSGDYIVRYDGTGTLTYDGTGVLDAAASQPGRDVIYFDSNAAVSLDITVAGTVEHIRVTLPGGICATAPTTRVNASGDCPAGDYLAFEAHPEEIRFNPDFLAFTKPFRALRFMDFMETNGSIVEQWSDRTLLTDEVWSEESGGPIEVMVELANRSDANPWFTLPHRADDNYVREFARYVRDNLNPNLKAYVEYTNEAWSPGNPQGQYVRNQGLSLNLATDASRAGGMFYAQRSLEVFKIWETEFGGLDRLVRVLSGQLVNTFLSGIILDHAASISDDPGPTTVDADVFGVNSYISGEIAYFRNEAQTVADIFAEMRNEDNTRRSLAPQMALINEHVSLVQPMNINLVAYEGGQALVDFATTTNEEHPNPLFFAANRDPEMKVMYGEILNAWKNTSATLFMHFSAPSIFNKSGSWGVKEYLTQPRATSPKFDGLMSFMENNTCWWANCVGTAGGTTAPLASFTTSGNELALTLDASGSTDADGSIRSYLWNFGDGNSGTGATTSHTYAQPGNYDVTLVTIDNNSNADTEIKQVTISSDQGQPPVAALTITPNGLFIDVNASGSTDDGNITSYDWDFGDGNTGTGETASHTYTTAGDYTVTLTVTDDDALTNATTQQVTIAAQNMAPTAAFTFTENGLTVNVDGNSSEDPDGSIASYSWDFGDGGTATGPTASHDYSTAGTYTVTLTVTDDDGLDNLTTQDVTVEIVNQAPIAGFDLDQTDLVINVASTSTDDNGITDFAWDFGDGNTATGQTASHTFAAAGTFTVSLTVTDGEGLTDSIDSELTVTAPVANNESPAAAFTVTENGLEISVDASGSVDNDGTIASYAWDLDDGTSATGIAATHTYITDGSYNISLTVTDNDGATDTTSQTISVAAIVPVNQAPVADFATAVDMLMVEVNAANSTDSDGTITDYNWDFGDGTNGTGSTLSHSYATEGDYTITLTVTDDGGETSVKTQAVTVSSDTTPSDDDDNSDNGGSFGLFWLLLMGFVFGRRFKAT